MLLIRVLSPLLPRQPVRLTPIILRGVLRLRLILLDRGLLESGGGRVAARSFSLQLFVLKGVGFGMLDHMIALLGGILCDLLALDREYFLLVRAFDVFDLKKVRVLVPIIRINAREQLPFILASSFGV